MTKQSFKANSDFRINKMTKGNNLYYEAFKSELSQIGDKSLAEKQELQETLLADLIRLSDKNEETARSFFGMSARELAQNWAGELPVPTFLEALKSGMITNIAFLIITISTIGLSHNPNFKFWVGIPFGVMFLISLLGSWSLSKLFPRLSRQARNRILMIISIPFFLVAIGAFIFFM